VDVDAVDDCEEYQSLAVASATQVKPLRLPIVGQCPDVNSDATRIPPTHVAGLR
jgi:hypothetical protein